MTHYVDILKKSVLLVILTLSLLACDESKKDDLSAYLAKVKERKSLDIEPLPTVASLDNFKFPEQDNRRNPFQKETEKKAANLQGVDTASDQKSGNPLLRSGQGLQTGDPIQTKRISLNFKSIPTRTVLQLLAEFAGINIVISDKVSGNISLHLNNILWNQALDIILKSKALDKRVTGNIMMIAPSLELISQENEVLKSQIEVKNLSPLTSDILQINYARAVDIATLIKDKDNSLLSSRGTINVDARTNMIWIQDTKAQIASIRALVQRLDVPVKQVLIEARIVNVTKDFAKDLGIRFGVSKPTHLSGTLLGANRLAQGEDPANVVPIAERLNVDLAAVPLTGSPASIGIALAKLGHGILLDLELSALESEGRGEVLASPRLITTNQQAAVIESGEEIPYQESTSSGATSVSFKKAVLSLRVTPQITPDNKIMMDLKINQDRRSPAREIKGVPAILTKQIQTNALVDDGETIVLGGVYQQDKANTMNRVPFLGSLPVLGHLFRNQHTTIANEELLIFITPRIITNTKSITMKEVIN
jgi:type IV pilus assembly protein PilQ